MIKIEAITLEEAYSKAANSLECSVTELQIEVVQAPSNGILGLFKKSAIIVATKKVKEILEEDKEVLTTPIKEKVVVEETFIEEVVVAEDIKDDLEISEVSKEEITEKDDKTHTILNDTIMPTSFVSMQDDDEEKIEDATSFLADYDDEEDEVINETMLEVAQEVQSEINKLFDFTCFNIETILVSVYDENTLLIEFKGNDAALLIGKEGYRYKALSYMIFNWINAKYQVQLRLEIAEFLKNQEESVERYLESVCESIEKDGRAQTKILDGVLVQIALKELRDRYPDKYVVIRTTRDGLKYIIINDYHSN